MEVPNEVMGRLLRRLDEGNLHRMDLQEIVDLAQKEFAAKVENQGDPCPFCGRQVQDDSVSSSYGTQTTTWTVDLVCSFAKPGECCRLSKNIHTSHIPHEDDDGGEYLLEKFGGGLE